MISSSSCNRVVIHRVVEVQAQPGVHLRLVLVVLELAGGLAQQWQHLLLPLPQPRHPLFLMEAKWILGRRTGMVQASTYTLANCGPYRRGPIRAAFGEAALSPMQTSTEPLPLPSRLSYLVTCWVESRCESQQTSQPPLAATTGASESSRFDAESSILEDVHTVFFCCLYGCPLPPLSHKYSFKVLWSCTVWAIKSSKGVEYG